MTCRADRCFHDRNRAPRLDQIPSLTEGFAYEWIDSSLAGESVCGHGHVADPDRAGRTEHHADPDRHPAGLQEPGGADADVLQRDVGQQHRPRHHQPHGAVDRPGQRHGAAGIAVDPRGQHRPQLLPGRRRPQRGADAGQLAGPGGDAQPAAGHAAAGRASLRPDLDHASERGGPRQRRPGEQRVDPLRRRPLRGPQHDHGQPGAVAPVVYGGKIRAVMAYLDRQKMQARDLRRSTS